MHAITNGISQRVLKVLILGIMVVQTRGSNVEMAKK